jgi:hypothetical protein
MTGTDPGDADSGGGDANARGGAGSCRACSAPLTTGVVACPRCGAAQRDDACPHCSASGAAVIDGGELRYCCGVCGGARLPLAVRAEDAARATPALQRSETARRSRAALRVGAGLFGASAGAATLLALVLAIAFGFFAGLAVLVLLGVPLAILAAMLVRRARERGNEIPAALDEAWLTVASAAANRAEGALTPEQLAPELGVDTARAEALLALLDANDVVRADVGDDGQLRYRPRLRVEAGSTQASDEELENRIQAEHEDAQAREDVARARQR